MARPPLFPALSAESPLAQIQFRQTMALGLLPLGVAILLMAAKLNDGFLLRLGICAGATLACQGALWGLWNRARRHSSRGFSTVHFLSRYFFMALCPILLWVAFWETLFEMAGWVPPVLFGCLVVLYPFGRILHARVGPDPLAAPHLEMTYMICQQLELVLLIFSIAGLFTGAILEANRDFPTDPFPVLVLIWLLALLGLLAGIMVGVSHWTQLFHPRTPPQTLDDPPPTATAPAKPCVNFGSDKF